MIKHIKGIIETVAVVAALTGAYFYYATPFYVTGYFSPEIAAPFKEYMRLHQLDSTITLAINSPGGEVDALNGIRDIITEAKKTKKLSVHCEGNGIVYSAAAVLLGQCDTIKMSPSTRVGFHMYRLQGPGGNVLIASPTMEPKMYQECIEAIKPVRKYLTDAEYAGFLVGQDIEMSGADFMKRYYKAGGK